MASGEMKLGSVTTIVSMTMTDAAIPCPAPILPDDFTDCRIPGGVDLWSSYGFYSPGVCFVGYEAVCTLTDAEEPESSILPDETVVRCIPSGYDCNGDDQDTRFATTKYAGEVLSAPAFEIRWRSEDVDGGGTRGIPLPGGRSSTAPDASSVPVSKESSRLSVAASSSTPPLNDGSSTASSALHATVTGQIHGETGSQLSGGSIAGIAVGGTVGLLVVVLLVGFISRGRRGRKDQTMSLGVPAGFWDQSTFTDGSTASRPVLEERVELNDCPMQPKELPASSKAAESETRKENSDGVQVRDSAVRLDPHVSVNSLAVELEATGVVSNDGNRAVRDGLRK